MQSNKNLVSREGTINLLTFFSITLFYFFESAQMGYFNVLAPNFLKSGIYQYNQISSLSAAYVYGCMIGLLPVGVALDNFPLRQILLWAIFGSIIGAFLLLVSDNFYMQWFARFVCGVFGGTFSFVGGIRVLATIYPDRFTFFMGLFLSAGMFGGLICQYPLLAAVTHLGISGAMTIIATFGLIVMVFNVLYLHPPSRISHISERSHSILNYWQICSLILRNYRNWLDCLMVILLDTPVSIIGTLWGVVLLMNYYHFSDAVSSWIIMSLFLGLMVGLPLWGALADRYNYPAWIIQIGAIGSFLSVLCMLLINVPNTIFIGCLFFALGLFSSCQTLGFTWLTKNMRPELIGQNSAFNSVIFMGTNGAFKQIGAYLLSSMPLFGMASSASNLLILMLTSMLFVTIYACVRNTIFTYISGFNISVLVRE